MKLTTCNEYFTDWPIEEVFDYAADLGYAAVEIAPFTLADSVEDIPASRRAQIRAAAERALASKSPAYTGSWPAPTGYTSPIPTQPSTSAPAHTSRS